MAEVEFDGVALVDVFDGARLVEMLVWGVFEEDELVWVVFDGARLVGMLVWDVFEEAELVWIVVDGVRVVDTVVWVAVDEAELVLVWAVLDIPAAILKGRIIVVCKCLKYNRLAVP